ncbi:MAG: geranylgeranyl reductase family protein [Candidatus Methylomirabilia bacterium]
MYDVLVVGGGPAGLYAAFCAARAGRSVALFEEHPEIGVPFHCTGLMAAEAFARFSLPEEAILSWHRATRFHSPAGNELAYTLRFPETVVVDRPRFDQGLATQAARAGVRLFLGTHVVRVSRDREGITLQAWGDRVVRGQLLILATGAGYHLHRELNLGIPGRFVQTAQVEVEFADTPEVEVYFGSSVAPGSFAWVVPIGRKGKARARIGVMASKDAEGYLQRFLRSTPVASRSGLRTLSRFRRRPIPLAPLGRTFGTRVLVVGDAAGLTKPTTGGGIYYSLLSGELAASVAQRALKAREYSEEFLSQYQRAWEAELRRELRWGSFFRRYAERLTDAQIDKAFQLAAEDPLDRLIRERATFNWHAELIRALLRDREVRGFVLRTMLKRGLQLVGGRDAAAGLPS